MDWGSGAKNWPFLEEKFFDELLQKAQELARLSGSTGDDSDKCRRLA